MKHYSKVLTDKVFFRKIRFRLVLEVSDIFGRSEHELKPVVTPAPPDLVLFPLRRFKRVVLKLLPTMQ